MKLAPQDAIALAHLGALYRLHGESPELGLHFCQQAVRLKWDDTERAEIGRASCRERV